MSPKKMTEMKCPDCESTSLELAWSMSAPEDNVFALTCLNCRTCSPDFSADVSEKNDLIEKQVFDFWMQRRMKGCIQKRHMKS